MGIWGIGLYDNDTSSDVRCDFEELYKSKITAQQITEKLTNEYECIFDDPLEESMFWLALADVQWDYGVLLPSVRESALHWINVELRNLKPQTKEETVEGERKNILIELRNKLLSPLPPTKKLPRERIYRCEWKIGDVFAYKIESDLAKEKGLFGRYFLIQKIGEATWYPKHIIPIVYVKITNDSSLPSSLEEYNRLQYVQTWFSRYEERFFPLDASRLLEDIAEKSKINYQVDEYGYLPQYRLKIIATSKKEIPSNLIFLGNYMEAERPKIEFVPHTHFNIVCRKWEAFGETLEIQLLKMYSNHNLRELEIYKK